MQPIHTVYGGAHLFKTETPRRLGHLAQKALEQYAPDAQTFAQAIGIPDGIAQAVHDRVREKLAREPVEDFRIDFEDGYGIRPDAEEDAHALEAARQLARGAQCPFIGIRVKAMSERALRTLDLFLTALGQLPPGFVVTLPKVSHPAQLSALVDSLERLEAKLGLSQISIEAMIELPQNILDAQGISMLPALRTAARGRLRGAHFGAYDYTAALGVAAAHQSMQHPACDFARQMMLHAYSSTEVMVSDGATTLMPVPRHRKEELTADQLRENARDVHAAWRGCTRTTSAIPCAAESTKAGTCTRRSFPAATAPRTASSSKRSRQRRSASRTSSPAPPRQRCTAQSSTTPPPARACSTSSSAASPAER